MLLHIIQLTVYCSVQIYYFLSKPSFDTYLPALHAVGLTVDSATETADVHKERLPG